MAKRKKNREQKNHFLVLSQNSGTHHSDLRTVNHCCDLETEVFGYFSYSIIFSRVCPFLRKTFCVIQNTQAGFKFRSLPVAITKRSTVKDMISLHLRSIHLLSVIQWLPRLAVFWMRTFWVQILQNTPFCSKYRIPPLLLGNENCQRCWDFWFGLVQSKPSTPTPK